MLSDEKVTRYCHRAGIKERGETVKEIKRWFYQVAAIEYQWVNASKRSGNEIQ